MEVTMATLQGSEAEEWMRSNGQENAHTDNVHARLRVSMDFEQNEVEWEDRDTFLRPNTFTRTYGMEAKLDDETGVVVMYSRASALVWELDRGLEWTEAGKVMAVAWRMLAEK